MPGKATVSTDEYRAAWARGGAGVRPQSGVDLSVGRFGEDPDELVAGASELIEMGVYPFVVPFRPHEGSLAVDVDAAVGPSG